MKVRVEKPKRPGFIVPTIIVLLIVGFVFFLPHFFQKPSVPLAYEVVGYEGDVQIMDLPTQTWRQAKRGEEFMAGQKIRTGIDGIINLQVEDEIKLRLKENAMLVNKECKLQNGKEIYTLGLDNGVLFGATTKPFDRKVEKGKADFMIATPALNAVPNGALFRIFASDREDENKVGVLRGVVEILKPGFFSNKHGYKIRGLEEAGLIEGQLQPATKITPEAWQELKEGYELLAKSAAMEAEQIDLSKKAGNFFSAVVFDHGTFFTPKVGYAGRDFFRDPSAGEVYLETEYDVFPPSSFVGIYIKTRNFDASKYEGLTFDVRRQGEEGYPDSFFIELKSKGNVVRRFSARGFLREWTPVEFKFYASKPTLINEVVFVFTHDRVGEAKKGVLEFRNFNLIPKPTPLPKPSVAPVAKKAEKSAVVQTPVQEKSPQPVVKKPAQKAADPMVPTTISLR